MPCDKCRKFWEKRKKEPDCDSCIPPILPENENAFEVYELVKRQAIYVGMNGVPVELDFKALAFTMQMLGVDDRPGCFVKVRKIWHHILSLDQLKREKNNKNKAK